MACKALYRPLLANVFGRALDTPSTANERWIAGGGPGVRVPLSSTLPRTMASLEVPVGIGSGPMAEVSSSRVFSVECRRQAQDIETRDNMHAQHKQCIFTQLDRG